MDSQKNIGFDRVREPLWRKFVGEEPACRVELMPGGVIRLGLSDAPSAFESSDPRALLEWLKACAPQWQQLELVDRGANDWLSTLRKIVGGLAEGTRICLDIPSADSCDLIYGADQPVSGELGRKLQALTRQGLTLLDGRPFLQFDSATVTRLICEAPPSEAHRTTPRLWQRALSWVGNDRLMQEFLQLLQEDLFASLPPEYCDRLWVRLERVAAKSADNQIQSQWQQQRTALDGGLNLAALMSLNPQLDEAWLERFNGYLSDLRCALLWHRLSFLLAHLPGCDLSGLLNSDSQRILQRWREMGELDATTTEICRSWHQLPEVREALEFEGINFGDVREYDNFASFQENYQLLRREESQ
ncbi:hypothetical protein [Candidatus Endoriftia persephonae]|jgi:hypothetical protein|uniref:Uncharacterized protein n=2 Tax=Gammaproteobacteria TaxID=1236 RepID=G2FB74_9GAMM|nr:hypothetical protein [Candidatus Endoriftia persephone]EGW56012.1 hypothetical protein TevJSym_aa01560 [endosymbiont of Tevnia jerichonana (vent Tica)]USF88135.1 hypothetical protein L0Y14_02525 [Candidatus Endoriftia persephone]